jgi:hypothetical protein
MSETTGNTIPVVVCTQHRGVFFGHADPDKVDGDIVVLTEARNCLHWTTSVGGVLGLAEHGPKSGCRIGARAPELRLRNITAVMRCTPTAAKLWEDTPCVS